MLPVIVQHVAGKSVLVSALAHVMVVVCVAEFHRNVSCLLRWSAEPLDSN